MNFGEGGGVLFPGGWDAKKNEMVLVTFGPGGYISGADFSVSVYIGFDKPALLKRAPVLQFITAAHADVAKIVAKLKREARAIGPLGD